MARWRAPTNAQLVRAGLWTLGISATAQVGAAAALMAVDAVRKRRTAPPGAFPRTEPTTKDIAGSAVTTYTYGEDLYADMLTCIRMARQTIFFETFIWKADEVGEAFKEALIEAAARGIESMSSTMRSPISSSTRGSTDFPTPCMFCGFRRSAPGC